jgi:GNAT superfamily N-acetyltransferase
MPSNSAAILLPLSGRTSDAFRVRRVKGSDIAAVISLDARVTKLPKPDYWADVYRRYGRQRLEQNFFLVAERGSRKRRQVVGFMVGEIRAWEFGSAPCGWVFALSIEPEERLSGAGTALFEAMAGEFRKAGVEKMRTMVARDSRLPMLFFRGEGMRAGPYIQLEKEIG